MANLDGDHSHQDPGITGEFMMLDKGILEIRSEERRTKCNLPGYAYRSKPW